MGKFIIKASESHLYTIDGEPSLCLQKDTEAYYHSDYQGGGRWKIDGTIENMICTLKNDITTYTNFILSRKVTQLKQILQADLSQIYKLCGNNNLMVCVVPRSKHEQHYKDNQKLFRQSITDTISLLRRRGINFIDGTHNIVRHTDTACTRLARTGNGGNGELPYCGITKETCHIIGVKDKTILLIDDVYTKSVGIDEDCIQALYDNGAKKVIFYSVGKTVPRY